jgi:hypothetical protein
LQKIPGVSITYMSAAITPRTNGPERAGKEPGIMNNAQIEAFRQIAAAMQGEAADWQWIGPYMSQRMFGITRKRAEAYAARHGGEARRMAAE